MKEFDLQKAIAGAKLVTRDGREVTDFAYLPSSMIPVKCVAVVGGRVTTYSDKGTWYVNAAKEDSCDLFIKEEEVQVSGISTLIPFDLEKAKKGESVVTRDGREVLELYHFSKDTSSKYPVVALLEDNNGILYYTSAGRYDCGGESTLDLFMAPRETKIYMGFKDSGTHSAMYTKASIPKDRGYSNIIELTFIGDVLQSAKVINV